MDTESDPSDLEGIERKPETIFEYRRPFFGATILCDGETSFVERFFKQDDFILPFGGWIALTDTTNGRSYLGVWGKRNAQRFRRLLRERGAEFTFVRGDQPGRQPLRWHTYPAAYHENRLSLKLARKRNTSEPTSSRTE